ncbi:MAG: hypothetical protein Q8L08_05775 [Candidatus Nanopelagicaceae bacterium]|nr:hypothetical protein [Candidatus Nanopelagicaceae bacterium]
MNEDKDFSLEDSEELINNLKSNAAPELEKLRSTLNLLSHVHELSPISSPPVLPSEIGQPVRLLTGKTSHTRRTVITSILSVGILASASLAAAAVTGRGPAPIVSAGHQSAKLVKTVAGAISNAVTGKHDEPPAKPSPAMSNPSILPGGEEENESDVQKDSEHSLIGPSSLPTSKGDDKATKSNSEESDDDGGISLSVTTSPGPITIKPSGIPKPTVQPEDDDEGDDD